LTARQIRGIDLFQTIIFSSAIAQQKSKFIAESDIYDKLVSVLKMLLSQGVMTWTTLKTWRWCKKTFLTVNGSETDDVIDLTSDPEDAPVQEITIKKKELIFVKLKQQW
jgi:hypothetical protein